MKADHDIGDNRTHGDNLIAYDRIPLQTVPLHSLNADKLPAVKAVQWGSRLPLKK